MNHESLSETSTVALFRSYISCRMDNGRSRNETKSMEPSNEGGIKKP